MRDTATFFPQDLLAQQGGWGKGSRASLNWMLVRRWRVIARRVMIVAITLLFIYSMASLLLIIVPVVRIPSLATGLYVLMCMEQVAWLAVLGVAFYVYCNKRKWMGKVTWVLFLLLFLRGVALAAVNLTSLWCARSTFAEQYLFTVPLDVVCVNGTCTLPVAENERPPVCAIMESFFMEVAERDVDGRAVAGVLFSEVLLQTFLAVAIIVHAIEDRNSLGH